MKKLVADVATLDELEVFILTISASTIARTVVLALALANQILTSFGIQTIPIEDETISTLISTAFLVVTTLVNWWKNNSFSKAAIASDKVKTAIKSGDVAVEDVEKMVSKEG